MLYKPTSIILGIQVAQARTETIHRRLNELFSSASLHIEAVEHEPNRNWLKELALFKVNLPTDQRARVLEQIVRGGFDIHYLSTRKIWEEEHQRIKLPTKNGFTYFPLQSVVRFESSSNYTFVHFLQRKRIILTKPLIQFEETLAPFGFCRVHHKHLINVSHVVEYQNGKGGQVILSDSSKVAVSARKKKGLMKFLHDSLDNVTLTHK